MSPSAFITTRVRTRGNTYVVRYRRGGRFSIVEHAGSFSTLREARLRRDFVAGELAAGRDPRAALAALAAVERKPRTIAGFGADFLASRVDLAPSTRTIVATHLRLIMETFGRLDPEAVSWQTVQRWVGEQSLAPSSLRRYLGTLRLLLDFAGLEPNPARDPRVRLPVLVTEEASPPSSAEVLEILSRLAAKYRLPFVLLEQTGMRVGELVSLEWGDVDVAGSRFRLRSASTKARRARWVQVPAWLMAHVDAVLPPEDRMPERHVFYVTEQGLKGAMRYACKTAKIAHYHPHDLRHRRGSLWHGQGVPARNLAERLGHSRASFSLDVYSHVLIDPAEIQPAEYVEALSA